MRLPHVSEIKNAGPNGETLFAISPWLSKGMGILVEENAPQEAKDYAKQQLLTRYKHERFGATILNKLGL